MYSLGLKVVPDFNTSTRNFIPGRETNCFPELGVGRRRIGFGSRDLSKNCRIVACEVERNGGGGGGGRESARSGPDSDLSASSYLSRTQTYALLKQQMGVAAKAEVSGTGRMLVDSLSI